MKVWMYGESGTSKSVPLFSMSASGGKARTNAGYSITSAFQPITTIHHRFDPSGKVNSMDGPRKVKRIPLVH